MSKITELRKKFQPFADKGWDCEGSDFVKDLKTIPCNILFNNRTDEYAKVTYDGVILDSNLSVTSVLEITNMAVIQGQIMKAR